MIGFKILEEKSIAYIVCSVIPLLAFSIFFADLICTTLSIFFIFYLIKKNHFIFYKNFFFLASLLFYFLCLFSSFLSGEILFSLKSSLPFIRAIIFIFLISYLIENNKYFLEILYNFLKYLFLILVIYGLGQYFYEYYIMADSRDFDLLYVRLKLPFSDEEKLGSYLIRLFGLLLAIYTLKKDYKKNETIFLFFLTICTSIVILLSGERSSFFFLILFLTICLIFLNINLKLKVTFLLSISIIFLLIFFQSSKISNRILFDKNNQLNITSNKDKIIIFTTQHTAHYLSGFEMFLDKPFTGQGPRMFRLLCKEEKFNFNINGKKSCSSHPHNTYVQLLAEIGFIGTFLFSLGFLHIIYLFSKQLVLTTILRRKNNFTNYKVIISASALLVFWPFSPSGNFFNNWILIINALMISFYVNEYFKYKQYK